MRIDLAKPSDKVGEIQVKGDNVTTGYYKGTVDTKAAFTADGWLKTGDLGYLDEEGFFVYQRPEQKI